MKWIEITEESRAMLAGRLGYGEERAAVELPLGWWFCSGFGDGMINDHVVFSDLDALLHFYKIDVKRIRKILNGWYTADSGKQPRGVRDE